MKQMTLREICTAAEVSRRAVQGYEKAGLIRPCGKNDRGYLLYDAETLEQIRTIRLYQKIGFRVREIAILLAASPKTLQKELARKEMMLLKEVNEKQELLQTVKQMIQRLESIQNLHN